MNDEKPEHFAVGAVVGAEILRALGWTEEQVRRTGDFTIDVKVSEVVRFHFDWFVYVDDIRVIAKVLSRHRLITEDEYQRVTKRLGMLSGFPEQVPDYEPPPERPGGTDYL